MTRSDRIDRTIRLTNLLRDHSGEPPERVAVFLDAFFIEFEAAAFEAAYMIARGHEAGDGFARHGTRQLYWKGRSDAATEIRQRAAQLKAEAAEVLSAADAKLEVLADVHRTASRAQWFVDHPEFRGRSQREIVHAMKADGVLAKSTYYLDVVLPKEFKEKI